MSGIAPRFHPPGLVARKLLGPLWELREELRYDSAILGARLIVPVGFISDLASVPRLPLAFWLAGDTAHAAGVIHDFLYRIHLSHRHPEDRRKIADAVFLEAMTCEGVPAWRRAGMYAAVRLFGGDSWRAAVNPPPA